MNDLMEINYSSQHTLNLITILQLKIILIFHK